MAKVFFQTEEQKMLKLPIMIAILFSVFAGGLAGLEFGSAYQIANVEHLGDFETDNPRDRSINETVAKLQRQNPNLTYSWVKPPNGLEVQLIAKALEAIPESAGIDSLYVVHMTPSDYIIFFQFLPFARNPYYYWVYRGDRR
jgi:hypothetical protein